MVRKGLAAQHGWQRRRGHPPGGMVV